MARRNNSDARRLIAALLVLAAHSASIAGDTAITVAGVTFGQVGVLMFFGISGYLVTMSWERDPRIGRFALKRCLRIFPALTVVLLATAFGLGPVITSEPVGAYLQDPQTWWYVAANLAFLYEQDLPGVFASNPLHEVNGSTWTLGPETHAYVLVAVAGSLGLLRVHASCCRLWPPSAGRPSSRRWSSLTAGWILSFCVGAAAYVWRIRLDARIAAVLVACWLASGSIGGAHWVAGFAIPYATLTIGLRAPIFFQALTARGDFSYGIYLYAFPVSQTWMHVAPNANIPTVMAGTLLVAVPLAMLVAMDRTPRAGLEISSARSASMARADPRQRRR